MAEREHFTNGRCLALGMGAALVTAAFSAQIGGWQHWVTIGVGYGTGIVLLLLACVLITKSYYSHHPASAPLPTDEPLPDIPTDTALTVTNGALFTPLQMEAFELARKLRKWRRGTSSPPSFQTRLLEPFMENIVGKGFMGLPSEMDRWRVRLNGGYVADFSQSVKVVVHRFAKENITDPHIEQFFERVRGEDDIREVELRLISMAHKVNGFDLEIPHEA